LSAVALLTLRCRSATAAEQVCLTTFACTPTPTDNAESSDPATPPKHVEQAFIQSHDEPMDGGKYLGHMEREWDGKFGSLPLYDDHNDEADADSPVKASSV